jgi:hypothetical protein
MTARANTGPPGKWRRGVGCSPPPRERSAVPLTRTEHSSVRGPSAQFYEFFYQIAKDSLDPRQFDALEDGAKGLERDYDSHPNPL